MSSGGQEFAYYWSGIYVADILFAGKEVLHKRKDPVSNQWLGMEKLKASDELYVVPLLELAERLEELNAVNWTGDTVRLSWGHRYLKGLVIEGEALGQKASAQVWAQRDIKCPLDVIVADNTIIGFVYTTREGCIVMVKPGYEEVTPLRYWQEYELSEPCHGIRHMGTHYVKMRDGVKLATEVWLPSRLKDGEKVPTILVRTPYGRFDFSKKELRFVHRGYAVVAQDTRGREDSEGEWIPMATEIDDGDDTLSWIAAQSWSDGGVGTIGGSYGGFVQWAAAASGNPHLKAIVSLVTAGSPFVDIPRKSGTFVSGMLAWVFMMAQRKADPSAMVRDDWDEILSIRPIKDIPRKALGKSIPFYDEWMSHPDYDDFWERLDWSAYGDKIDVPALIISGWYDDDGMGTTEAWDMVNEYKRKDQKLILGPWFHSANTTRDIHNVSFGNNAIRYDLDLLYLLWFDKYLKGIANGVDESPRVEYYLVGENRWTSAKQWPPEETEYKKMYLHSGGQANTSSGDGALRLDEPDDQPADSYQFDPQDPAPFLIDVSENECNVPENYKEVEKREDVLVYTSAPLKEDIAIAGDIYAELYASSSARDTDWVVRLTDVDQEGNSIRLSDGIIRARYRNSFEHPELLEPGRIEKYCIRMTKVANVFRRGHRIRVEITSGAKNLCFPNHNTGNDPAVDTEFVVADQRIYHDDRYPTHISFPVLYGDIE